MNIPFLKSPNFTNVIDKTLLVIHWTAGPFESCISWFQNEKSRASAHYVVAYNGEIVQMVEEEDVAWHAGVSSWKNYPTIWQGVEWGALNPCSIGIEAEGPPTFIRSKLLGLGLRVEWQDAQIRALAELCKDIRNRHPNIKIIDHSRICAAKIDVIEGTGKPEDAFPWAKLLELSGVPEA